MANDDISNGVESVPILSESSISESLKAQGFQPTAIDHSIATVIRIKRKLTEEPAEALLLTCKRKKFMDKKYEETNVAATDVDKSVFHFATTIKCKTSLDIDDKAKVQDAISLRKHLTKGRYHCKNIVNNISPNEQQCLELLQTKLKSVVIGRKRTANEPANDSPSKHPARQKTPSPVEFLNQNQSKVHEEQHNGDVPSPEVGTSSDQNLSDDIYCNSVKLIREKNTAFDPPIDEFVYDVYFSFQDMDWSRQDILDMKPCKYEDFVWDSIEEAQATCDDEDDSNDEDNWRNDYPDEEDGFDENFKLFDEEEGSSSDDYDRTARYIDDVYHDDRGTYHRDFSYSDEDY